MQRSGPEIGLDSVKVERRWFSWMLRTFTEQEGSLKALILLDLLWSVGGSSYSHNWHSVFSYGSKTKIKLKQPCVFTLLIY